ncbi:MAG: HipA N-terminal domain-containing protein [Betaproteobacteria bacterium]|nr:HipA N-terminal domain-containing protein [Betaproteobacteria bacterium]
MSVGSLTYFRQGQRENSAFAYEEAWLSNPARFNVSADLQLTLGFQHHKAVSSQDSPFHGAIADTAPDAWGRRVIARDHGRVDETLTRDADAAHDLIEQLAAYGIDLTEVGETLQTDGLAQFEQAGYDKGELHP